MYVNLKEIASENCMDSKRPQGVIFWHFEELFIDIYVLQTRFLKVV
jgi:hypothetical protein